MLSIGLVRLWNSPVTWFIYTTPALLILGYTAQYCAVTTRLSLAGLFLIPKTVDEAARLSGASWARRLFRIFVPLSTRTLVCAWLAAYILCLRDVPLALMTAPPGGDPLPARILDPDGEWRSAYDCESLLDDGDCIANSSGDSGTSDSEREAVIA